ncbi:MAG TPA: NHL repeat-containing protein [bacterium]|nr:NHL repeat-containing protein [bacterium]
MAKTPAKYKKVLQTKGVPKAPAKGRKGAVKPAKKKRGKGFKALVLLFLLGLATIVVGLAVRTLTDLANNAKKVAVMVDMELGQGGTGPGHFREPVDVAVDRAGDFYVSDFGGHDIQKFDPNGAPLFTIGQEGKGDGEFEQPSGLYVDAQDNLWVCDTFNHRIQEFDPSGKFLKTFSHGFFGPRSIVGNGLNRLYVSDTGNHKVQVFDLGGNFIKEWGGFGTTDGKFREPVGITADDHNAIYVADSDNLRIQKFDPDGKFMGAFKISTWKGKNDEVPYLTFGADALWASSTSLGAVLKLDPNGKLLAICLRKDVKKEADSFPGAAGLAINAEGRVLVVEKGKGQVARFLFPAVPGQ